MNKKNEKSEHEDTKNEEIGEGVWIINTRCEELWMKSMMNENGGNIVVDG